MTIDTWPSDISHGVVDFDLVGGERSGPAFGELPPPVDPASGGPHWVARLDRLPLRKPAEISAARGLQTRLAGGSAPVMIPCCEALNPGGVVTVGADAAAGATSLTLSFAGAHLPLQGGEPFSPLDENGDKRLHRVEAVTGGTDDAPVVRINPPLRSALSAGDPIDFETPACPMSLAGGFGLPLELGRFSSVEATFTEWFDPAPVLLLRALSLTPDVVASGAPEDTFVGNILGATAGSTLTLEDDAGGRFKLVLEGSTWKIYAGAVATDYAVDVSHDITVRETLDGYANSPRDNVLTIDVQVVGYRYWRLVLQRGSRDNFTSITAIELAESEDGDDVAGEATITAGGSGTNDSPMANAFDGNPLSQWNRNIASGTFQANFDFGASAAGWKQLVQARLTGSYDTATRSPRGAELFYSADGVTYTSAAAATYGDSWVRSGVRTVPEADPPAGYYRVHRLFMQTNNGGNLTVLGEIEFLGEAGSDILPTGHTDDSSGRVVVASTAGGGNAPYYGFDNNTGTGYASDAFNVIDQYFTYVFPEPVRVTLMRATMMSTGIADPAGRGPRDVSRQASHTQSSWFTFASLIWTGWGPGTVKSI